MGLSKECESLAGRFIEAFTLAEWMPRWLEWRKYRVLREDSRVIKDMMTELQEEAVLSKEEVGRFDKFQEEMEDALDREDWKEAESVAVGISGRILALMLEKVVDCECKKRK